MNVSQLSAFHAVMTSATLTEAADRLNRTQPAISAAIKSLEDQLGMRLFERQGRKLIPVPEAQYLLAETSEILKRLTQVRHTMHSLADGQTGRLNVAAMPGPVTMIFPKFIAQTVRNAADIKVSIQARTSTQIAELTRAQSIDFGFADAPEDSETETLYQTDVITADCLIALPAEHRLASKDWIGIEDLNTEPIGILPASHRHSRELQAQFQARGLTFNTTVESQTFLPILQFVAAGQCATVLDPLSAFFTNGPDAMVRGITVRPMAHPIRYHYAIYSPRYRPISVFATDLRRAWRDEVMRLLHSLGASPQRVTGDMVTR